MYIKSININTPIYNGKSLKYIIKSLPKKMHKVEKTIYILNCIEVYHNTKHKINEGYTELLKNNNHRLIKAHFKL